MGVCGKIQRYAGALTALIRRKPVTQANREDFDSFGQDETANDFWRFSRESAGNLVTLCSTAQNSGQNATARAKLAL
jgi:hypothetical protein